MKYRQEIDGLRAVAVLPVILFHAEFSVFSGGFVGVDVFFVISGYLITSILISELQSDDFSISRFYERRARRILPALFFVMVVCLPFAYLWMLPEQLRDFSESIVAVVFFSSNILFWRESGYFGAAAELKPLLHTWSLAVEEQYYVLFPLFLLFSWRFGRRRVLWAVIVIAIISLLLAEWGWRYKPSAAFYLAPPRAWELLAGSICAFLTVGKAHRSSNVLSAIGLSLIVISIFTYDASTPFPSLYTLAPVVGTALVILFATEGTWTAWLLSLRGFVGIGLISYSAYLWHQPLFAFARLRSMTEPSHALMSVLALAALFLAWLTWRFVEQPFRHRSNGVLNTKRSVFGASGAVAVILVSLGFAGYVGNGFEGRLSEKDREIIARSQPVFHSCGETQDCLLGNEDNDFSGIAFVGDSHMGRYAYLLNEFFDERAMNALYVSGAWCAPLLSWEPSDPWRCGGQRGYNFQSKFLGLIHNPSVHTVVLAAQWANYSTGYRHGAHAITYDFKLDSMRNQDVFRNPDEFALALEYTVDAFTAAGKRLVLIGPVPEYDFNVAEVVLHLSRYGGPVPEGFEMSREIYLDRNDGVLAAFAANDDKVTFLDVWPIVCSTSPCRPVSKEGFPLYNDGNHMVPGGMSGIVEELLHQLDL